MKVPSHILEKFIKTRFCQAYPEHFTEVGCAIQIQENKTLYKIRVELKKFEDIKISINGSSYFKLKMEIGRKLKTYFNLHRSEFEIYFIYNKPSQIIII